MGVVATVVLRSWFRVSIDPAPLPKVQKR